MKIGRRRITTVGQQRASEKRSIEFLSFVFPQFEELKTSDD